MNKEDFFRELEESLQGEVSESEYRDSIDYYRGYFREQEALGRDEQDILSELGNARYIAHSIIDAHGLDHERIGKDTYYSEGSYSNPYREPGEEIVNESETSPVENALYKTGRIVAVIAGLLLVGVMLQFLLPFILVIIAVIVISNWLHR